MQHPDFKFLVGIDWGSVSHQVCVGDRNGSIIGESAFAHGGEGLGEMIRWILEICGPTAHNIGAAIEVPNGPVVETLMEKGFSVHSINPRQMDRFRDRFSPSGAKDDRRDAHVLASALRTDAHLFRRLEPAEPDIVLLRELSRMREELVGERKRLVAKMRAELWKYYPQFEQLVGNTFHSWLLELWRRVPTPQAARRTRWRTIEKLLGENRVRRFDAKRVLEILGSREVDVRETTRDCCVMRIESIAERLKVVLRQIKDTERKIDRTISSLDEKHSTQAQHEATPSDVKVLSSVPGVGRVVLAAMFGEAHELVRRRDYRALRNFTGAAPVTRQSGKSRSVNKRRASQKRLVNMIYHWARVAVQHDPVSKAKYASLRGRGHGHYRALRSVADRLLYVACALLEKGALFDKNFTKGGLIET